MEKRIVSMSSGNDALERWIAQALQRKQQQHRLHDASGHVSSRENVTAVTDQPSQPDEPDEIRRMIDLIDAASAEIPTFDLGRVEAAFAGQAVALEVIFNQFTRAAARKYYAFDSMRLALRAQAQCRATYQGLIALNAPPRPAPSRLRNLPSGASAKQENSSEQTNGSGKS
jgi:hypothetical protein